MRGDSTEIIRRPKRPVGFTIMEVVLALVVFLVMVLVFAAVFPMAVRGAQSSGNYNQAAMLAQHKLDQLRAAGFAVLKAPGGAGNQAGTLETLGLIDTGSIVMKSAPSTPLDYTATFTGVDDLTATVGAGSGYFPVGASGTVRVQDLSAVNAAAAPPAGTVYLITVTVQWPGGAVSGGRYSASTLIAAAGGKS